MRNYIETQERVDACFVNKTDWDRKSILNVARAGHFSSDRTVLEYTREIWNVKPVEVGDAAPPEPRVRS
jgi:glycogen phosphorylase